MIKAAAPLPARSMTQVTDLHAQLLEARAALAEAEQTLAAIRAGEIDALVVDGPSGKRVYTLQSADQPYRVMVEHMQEGALTILPDGAILYANSRFARMLERPLEKVIGGNLRECLSPADASTLLAALGDTGEAGEVRLEVEIQPASGPVPVQISACALDLSGARCFCVVATDLTHQRRHEQARGREEQLRLIADELDQAVTRRTAEVRQRASELQSLAAQLGRAEHRERQRLAQLLHDGLQQLLVAAKMRAALMERDLPPDRGRNHAEQLRDALNESLALCRNLATELSPPVLNSAGLPAALEWLARWMRAKHQILVDVRIDEPVDPGDSDLRILLFEGAREALLNVAKHAGVNRATLRLSRDDAAAASLTIEDRGCGLGVHAIASASTTGGGFGLMSIRERLNYLGGRLEVQCPIQTADAGPSLGPGTRVILHFATEPAGDPEASAPPVLTDNAPGGIGQAAGRVRVLVADDHRLVRQGLVGLLARQSGMVVVGEVADGQRAVEYARRLRPDVVLMDVNMPVLSGIDATRQIKAELPDVRVIGLTMHTDLEVRDAMCRAGASGFQTKDGPVEALIAAILCRAGPAEGAP